MRELEGKLLRDVATRESPVCNRSQAGASREEKGGVEVR